MDERRTNSLIDKQFDGSKVLCTCAYRTIFYCKKRRGNSEGRKIAFIRIFELNVRNRFCDLFCFRIFQRKVRNHFCDFSFYFTFESLSEMCENHSLPHCHAFFNVFICSGLFHLSFIYLCSF